MNAAQPVLESVLTCPRCGHRKQESDAYRCVPVVLRMRELSRGPAAQDRRLLRQGFGDARRESARAPSFAGAGFLLLVGAAYDSAVRAVLKVITVPIPSSVIATLPATCTAIAPNAHCTRPAVSCPTTSAEKAENVVRPPRKPVMTSSRHSGDREGCAAKKATATPIRYPPTRLAASVPGGMKGNSAFRCFPSTHRRREPPAAPTLIARIERATPILSILFEERAKRRARACLVVVRFSTNSSTAHAAPTICSSMFAEMTASTVFQTIRSWARRIKRDGVTLWFAYKAPQTPLLAKALCVFMVAYALSPIDLIPDFIPVLGYLDDVILLPGLIWLAIRVLPKPVVEESRIKADAWLEANGRKPRSYLGAALIIAIWAAVAWALWHWYQQF